MGNQSSKKIRRAGAYVINAAESRPSRVPSKSDQRVTTPSGNDKTLARELLKTKRG